MGIKPRIERIKRIYMESKSGSKRPTCARLWTAQKGRHVTVSTKITREEYERFIAIVKVNRTNKNQVLKMFIRSYINNII